MFQTVMIKGFLCIWAKTQLPENFHQSQIGEIWQFAERLENKFSNMNVLLNEYETHKLNLTMRKTC